MQHHNYSFFGQKVGMIFDSADWSECFVFLRFLKKKPEGIWEKPSLGEGKSIKINLLELIAILDTINQESGKWSTVHKYQNDTTSITMIKEKDRFQIILPGYSKFFGNSEMILFQKLLAHVVEEKIINATGKSSDNNSNIEDSGYQRKNNVSSGNNKLSLEEQFQASGVDFPYEIADEILAKNYSPDEWISALEQNEEFYHVPGEIMAKREKALSFKILDNKQIWVPLSQIDPSNKSSTEDPNQGLWIKKWFLNKKLSDIFGEA